jgi:hypothetical protein
MASTNHHGISRDVLVSLGTNFAAAYGLARGGDDDKFIDISSIFGRNVHGCVITADSFRRNAAWAESQTAKLLGLSLGGMEAGRPLNRPKRWILAEAVVFLLAELKCCKLLLHALTQTGVVCIQLPCSSHRLLQLSAISGDAAGQQVIYCAFQLSCKAKPGAAVSKNVLRLLGGSVSSAFVLSVGGPNGKFVDMTKLFDVEILGCVLRKDAFNNKYGRAEETAAGLIACNLEALTNGRPPNSPLRWIAMEAIFCLLEDVKCMPWLLHALTATGAVHLCALGADNACLVNCTPSSINYADSSPNACAAIAGASSMTVFTCYFIHCCIRPRAYQLKLLCSRLTCQMRSSKSFSAYALPISSHLLTLCVDAIDRLPAIGRALWHRAASCKRFANVVIDCTDGNGAGRSPAVSPVVSTAMRWCSGNLPPAIDWCPVLHE